ncbi:DUF2946 family protein [Sphingomonas sp. LT1P40]|uniref:DUF2946 family protein n=1 Tax=Alteristakelama amylovorans TaxID=3096166 RepID=UPI002FC8F64A
MFRGLILSHPRLAAALIALAVLMKIVVPAGFMPVMDGGKMIVMVCTGMGQQQVEIDVPGMPAKEDGATRTAAQPCAFAGFADALLPGADPVQLAAALVFILALGFVAVVLPALLRPRYLHPPLRGPPVSA